VCVCVCVCVFVCVCVVCVCVCVCGVCVCDVCWLQIGYRDQLGQYTQQIAEEGGKNK